MKTGATKKIPGEGVKRAWPPLINMDESVKVEVNNSCGENDSMSSKRKKNAPLSKGAIARPKARLPQSACMSPLQLPAGLNRRGTVLGAYVILAAVVWIVFGQALHFEFINDDYVLYRTRT